MISNLFGWTFTDSPPTPSPACSSPVSLLYLSPSLPRNSLAYIIILRKLLSTSTKLGIHFSGTMAEAPWRVSAESGKTEKAKGPTTERDDKDCGLRNDEELQESNQTKRLQKEWWPGFQSLFKMWLRVILLDLDILPWQSNSSQDLNMSNNLIITFSGKTMFFF